MTRPRKAAGPFRHFNSSPEAITTDGLRSYKAAMVDLGSAGKQGIDRWADNRVGLVSGTARSPDQRIA